MKSIHTFVVLAYKESNYLEDCIKSVVNQEYKSEVVIATTTDNKFIRSIAKKYKLDVIVGEHTNIGGDFDFAVSCGKTKLVTVAHQDDIYDKDYSKYIVEYYNKYKDSIIIFPDYYEIRNDEKVYKNTNLNIKKILLLPSKMNLVSNTKFIKRFPIRFGNAICCPAVTFVKDNVSKEIFNSDLKCNIDWLAWERLSKLKGRFTYISKPLMGHRVHEGSTTTEIIKDNIRTKEDFEIFKKLWPVSIAKLLTKF